MNATNHRNATQLNARFLHVGRQNVRYKVLAEILLAGHKHHLAGGVLVQPGLDDGPDRGEHHRGVQHQTRSEPLREVLAEQPNQVLDQLVVHAGRAEPGQVEHDAQVVGDLLEALFARLVQAVHDELGQLVDVPLGGVVFGWNVDDGSAGAVPVPKDARLVGVGRDGRLVGEPIDAVLLAPLVCLQDGLLVGFG